MKLGLPDLANKNIEQKFLFLMKKKSFHVEKPGRYHLNQMIKRMEWFEILHH